MKKIIISILVFFFTSVNAEWIFLKKSQSGVEFWYDKKRINKKGHTFFVWYRFKYPEEQMGNRGAQIYYKINCLSKSYQGLVYSYYSDENFKIQKSIVSKPSDIVLLKNNSPIDLLANSLCDFNK